MKRLLMLKPEQCASGDTKKGKIYDIVSDELSIWDATICDSLFIGYNKENLEKYPNAVRWITIKDESGTDSLEVYKDDTRFIIFENDKELAHELVNTVEGLDIAIVNMAIALVR